MTFPVFPCYRYRAGEAKVFHTAEQLAAAGDGWVDSPAKVGQIVPPEPPAEPRADAIDFDGLSIESLRAIADEHSIEYDGRWKEKRLIQAINEAIAKAQA